MQYTYVYVRVHSNSNSTLNLNLNLNLNAAPFNQNIPRPALADRQQTTGLHCEKQVRRHTNPLWERFQFQESSFLRFSTLN